MHVRPCPEAPLLHDHRHAPHLDIWRGLSVLLVVTHHVAIRLPLAKTTLAAWLPERLVQALCWNGYEAVLIFFVISGFLITTHTLDRHGDPASVDLRAFWVRRFARIAPPLLLLVAVLSCLHLAGVGPFVIDTERQSLALAVLSALTLWLNQYEAHTGYLPGNWDVLWSLSIEELFYLGFPLLLWVARTERRLLFVLAPFAFLLPVFHAWAPAGIAREKATLPAMAAIAAGVLAAVAVRHLPRDRTLGWALSLAGGAMVLSVLGWGDVWWATLRHGMLWVHVGGSALAVAGAWQLRGPPPTPWTAPARFLGRLSYEVYLTHMFVVFALVALWDRAGLDTGPAHWAYVFAVAASTALGFVFARAWSDPCNRVLRRRLLP